MAIGEGGSANQWGHQNAIGHQIVSVACCRDVQCLYNYLWRPSSAPGVKQIPLSFINVVRATSNGCVNISRVQQKILFENTWSHYRSASVYPTNLCVSWFLPSNTSQGTWLSAYKPEFSITPNLIQCISRNNFYLQSEDLDTNGNFIFLWLQEAANRTRPSWMLDKKRVNISKVLLFESLCMRNRPCLCNVRLLWQGPTPSLWLISCLNARSLSLCSM